MEKNLLPQGQVPTVTPSLCVQLSFLDDFDSVINEPLDEF